MPIPKLIDRDARCAQCKYNLRGLTLDDACPECGTPILKSIRYAVQGSVEMKQRRASLLEPFAEASGYSLDAMEFVLDLLRLCTSQAGHYADPSQITARDVCRDLAEYAKYHFGGEDDALLALEAMGLSSSEDLGRIIFAMVDAGLLRASAEDKPSDFDNLFTLDTLFGARDAG